MNLYAYRRYFTDERQLVRIFNTNNNELIYEGNFNNMPEEYDDCEISSIDTTYPIKNFDGYIGVNVYYKNN